MKRRVKKTVSFLLYVLMFILALSACSNDNNNITDPAVSDNNTQSPEEEKQGDNEVEETITFDIFLNLSAPEYPEDGGKARQIIINWAEERGVTGVDYRVQMASGDEYFTKLNLLAASDELPDYFSLDRDTMYRFASEGLILPLDDLIAIMTNAQKFWRQEDLDAVKYDGNVYAFPGGYRPEPINQPNAGTFVIRKDWLDNLGLERPETLDDYYNVMKAFTLSDPDKNGQNDTYGLGGNKDTYFDAIFGAYGVSPFFWHERDGKLKQGNVLPEAKEVLELLQGWYREGLIDPEFMIIDNNQLQEKVINSKIGFYSGTAYDTRPISPVSAALTEITPEAVLVSANPPAGSSGDRGWPETPPGYSKIQSIAASCKDAELLARFLDTLLDDGDNNQPFIYEGLDGEHYEFDEENNRIIVGEISEQLKDGFSHPVQFIKIVDRRWVDSDILEEALEIANKYTIKNEFWGNVQAIQDYPDLEKLWQEYFTKIVSGELSIGAWDEYVEKYYEQGGTELEQQVNEAWKNQ